jgi:hypothetical protein
MDTKFAKWLDSKPGSKETALIGAFFLGLVYFAFWGVLYTIDSLGR